jgi:hypothetical protein
MKLLKPISDEDQKLLLTDSYYSALKMLPILFEGVVERRFSLSDIEAIRKTLEIQHFSFQIISFVIYAPFIVRQWVRGNSFVEFRSEQLLSLASGRQNLGNFIHLTSLFNYVAKNSFSMSVFKYNIYFETLYSLINEEFKFLSNFPKDINSLMPLELLRVLKIIHKQQELWISKLYNQEMEASKNKNNLEVIFDNKRRNVNELLSKFTADIDHMLNENGSVKVFRFDLKYQGKINKYQELFTEMKKHRAKLLSYLRNKYQKVGKYHGFIWKVNFDHEYNLSLHLITFFSESVNAETVIRDVEDRWSQKITKECGEVDHFFHYGYAADYVENNLIDYKYYGAGIVRRDNDHDRLRLIQACRYVALPQLYLSFDLTEQDRSCTFVKKKTKNKLVYSTFY